MVESDPSDSERPLSPFAALPVAEDAEGLTDLRRRFESLEGELRRAHTSFRKYYPSDRAHTSWSHGPHTTRRRVGYSRYLSVEARREVRELRQILERIERGVFPWEEGRTF